MTIPTSSNFPETIDTNENLYMVHDSMRLRLAADYNIGNTSITVEGDETLFTKFPTTGLITLTEQCSEPSLRAIAFFYKEKLTNTTTGMGFGGLELLPGFVDNPKPKTITNVTMNVMADHHNNIKNAVIAVQEFLGVQGTIDLKPFGPTMEGRTNFLRKLILIPRAWFTVDKTIGLVPFTVVFTNQSFRTAADGCGDPPPVSYEWDFGDNSGSIISIISATTSVPPSAINVVVEDIDGGTISKTYNTPGIFDVSLTVSNIYGIDKVILPGIINARIAAPDQAAFEFIPLSGQTVTPGVPDGGPFIQPPVVRAAAGSIIGVEVPQGINPNTGRTYGGELVDGNNVPIDPIAYYTWSAGDDLPHANSYITNLSYSIGGTYDLILRVDTKFGAYRITQWNGAVDIIEQSNLWLWTISPGQSIRTHEFGLISETFKSKAGVQFPISYDYSFLDPAARNYEQQLYEFTHNNGFTPRGTTPSGEGGTCLLFWASGRTSSDPPSSEEIHFLEYEGFSDAYTHRLEINRPWNWCSFSSPGNAYFILGGVTGSIAPDTSPTNQKVNKINLVTETDSSTTLTAANYLNGATELMSNPAQFDGSGNPLDGHMSVYRSAWKDSNGYFVRNDAVGDFYKLRGFYRTEPVGTVEFVNIRRLADMGGLVKLEGRLVPMSTGLYFFNNSGAISAYNDTTGAWVTGGPGLNSASFRNLQDSSVVGYDSQTNTLLAASDNDHKAYLSFDYSTSAFIKFNDANTTFSSLSARPEGNQWLMGVF